MIESDPAAVAITMVRKSTLDGVLAGLAPMAREWVKANAFAAEPGTVCLMPAPTGGIAAVLLGVAEEDDPWACAALPGKLPPGSYRIAPSPDAKAATQAAQSKAATQAAVAWMLGTYAFSRYKSRNGRSWPSLVWPEAADRGHAERLVRAVGLVRDLVNTPAADLGPAELADAAGRVAARHGAEVAVIAGDALLTENYPAIHAVGRAAAPHRQPRLIDLVWGKATALRVTLVGKGVCFDTGGLDLKPSSSMKLMKKDMGGAAHALALADMIMGAGLPVRLRLLIPAVENAVAGDAMRPLDVLRTRKGLTVEVGNTDAEGRLILADALAEASRDRPDLLLDIATLTGAARTALGPDLPALFCNNDLLASDLLRAGETEGDPLWRLPLHKPYRRMLDSKVADLGNVSDSPHAGAITAALFLQEFVAAGIPWAHLDVLAWNGAARPGRPEGGEAMGLRALYAVVAGRFSKG